MSLRQDHRGNGQVGGMRLADGWVPHLKGEQQRPYSPPQDLAVLCALPQACTFVWAEESRLISASYSMIYAVAKQPTLHCHEVLGACPQPRTDVFFQLQEAPQPEGSGVRTREGGKGKINSAQANVSIPFLDGMEESRMAF